MTLLEGLLCAALGVACAAGDAGPGTKVPLKRGASGVALLAFGPGEGAGVRLEGRFVLDTGSQITVLDTRRIARMGLEPVAEVQLATAFGGLVDAREYVIPRILVAGRACRNLHVVGMDLEAGVGTLEDEPLEGILGMNALDGRTLDLDFEAGEARFDGARPTGMVTVPLVRKGAAMPSIQVDLRGRKVLLECDTGFTGFLSLPAAWRTLAPATRDPRTPSLVMDAAGGEQRLERFDYEGRLAVGGGAWCHPSIQLEGEDARPSLGMRALGPRFHLDLAAGTLGLRASEDGCLQVSPDLKCPLAVRWQTVDGQRRLVVRAAKPGSAFEKAGFRPGDQILAAGPLREGTLGIAALRDLIASSRGLRFRVRRQAEAFDLEVAP